MKIVFSKNHIPIRITNERIEHISRNHPELAEEIDKIVETLEMPDTILEGDFGELLAVKRYEKTPVSKNKYLVVVFKEVSDVDGFVLTAYFSRRLRKGRKIQWKP